jgi:hypothetical protein
MAGQLPSFVNGSAVLIKIGDVYVAYCQDLRFSRSMANVPVRGIGSYSAHALEPVDYSATGQMTITRYTSKVVEGGDDAPKRNDANSQLLPANLSGVKLETPKADVAGRDGNSILAPYAFDPRRMLLSATFDIQVFERGVDAGAVVAGSLSGTTGNLLYTFQDCRLTNYSFSFAPGQILNENVSFICRFLKDEGV